MLTVREVEKLTGVTKRTLHYYDKIGLLKPTRVTQAGYRLYDETALEKLQTILFFRELAFPLKDIVRILESDGYDRKAALQDQIKLLKMQRAHLDGLIRLAQNWLKGEKMDMDFSAFDKSKQQEYAAEAKARWGETAAFAEAEAKAKEATPETMDENTKALFAVFSGFAALREGDPAGPEAKAQVLKLQKCISERFYKCTDEILLGLSEMYVCDERFRESIDQAGAGTAAFVKEAVAAHLKK